MVLCCALAERLDDGKVRVGEQAPGEDSLVGVLS